MPLYGYPVIPETITVHLGKPDEWARNIEVNFSDYIKNVASSAIYPTWPENAIRANIYTQVSYALNRIYSEHYRSRGYDFDITSTTQYDQSFVEGRNIFENIGQLVDDLFNDYVYKTGSIRPYFTQYCNGTTSKCKGLSQWGTVDLAKEGYHPYEILKYYYGDDINIMFHAPVQNVSATYPGFPLKLGSSSNLVEVFQGTLNRIGKNYPSIPIIEPITGVFDLQTEEAVKAFQRIFNLDPNGIIGKGTWYKIIQIYNGVTKASELNAEGLSAQLVEPVFLTQLSLNSSGNEVTMLQYYVSFVAYFNNAIPILDLDGFYGPKTEDAIRQFQSLYGLNPTGITDGNTWNSLEKIYKETISSLSESFYKNYAKLYPGYILTPGLKNNDVAAMQAYLNRIAEEYPSIGQIPITGYYGDLTAQSILHFREQFDLPQYYGVGPLTWARLAIEYNKLQE